MDRDELVKLAGEVVKEIITEEIKGSYIILNPYRSLFRNIEHRVEPTKRLVRHRIESKFREPRDFGTFLEKLREVTTLEVPNELLIGKEDEIIKRLWPLITKEISGRCKGELKSLGQPGSYDKLIYPYQRELLYDVRRGKLIPKDITLLIRSDMWVVEIWRPKEFEVGWQLRYDNIIGIRERWYEKNCIVDSKPKYPEFLFDTVPANNFPHSSFTVKISDLAKVGIIEDIISSFSGLRGFYPTGYRPDGGFLEYSRKGYVHIPFIELRVWVKAIVHYRTHFYEKPYIHSMHFYKKDVVDMELAKIPMVKPVVHYIEGKKSDPFNLRSWTQKQIDIIPEFLPYIEEGTIRFWVLHLVPPVKMYEVKCRSPT